MATDLTAAERSMRSRVGAYVSWANTADRPARTAAARDGFLAQFEREVDPDGVLSIADRLQRAEAAKKGYMTALAPKSAQARRRKAA